MRLEGIHHITAITGDAPRNVDFYARLLGMRMIKKTVNFDRPDVYHLYYADEGGSPGAVLTFFEFPGAPPGRTGAGMVHRIVWRVAGVASLDFWAERLAGEGVAVDRADGRLRFRDPDGMDLELAAAGSADPPLRAEVPDVPAEHALLGFEGVRAYAATPRDSHALLHGALGFAEPGESEWRVAGETRHASYRYDPPPPEPGLQGAGSVHHIAWASRDFDHEDWRNRAIHAGARVTPVIDRQYFRSIYFREPSGVLFEIATLGPGFAVDEPVESLGERLALPPRHEHMREMLERTLVPLENPRMLRAGE